MNTHSETMSPDESIPTDLISHSTGSPVEALNSIAFLAAGTSSQENEILPLARLVKDASVPTTNILSFSGIALDIANGAAPVANSAPIPCTAQYIVLNGF